MFDPEKIKIIDKIYKEQQLRRLIVDFFETDNKELKEELYNIIVQLLSNIIL